MLLSSSPNTSCVCVIVYVCVCDCACACVCVCARARARVCVCSISKIIFHFSFFIFHRNLLDGTKIHSFETTSDGTQCGWLCPYPPLGLNVRAHPRTIITSSKLLSVQPANSHKCLYSLLLTGVQWQEKSSLKTLQTSCLKIGCYLLFLLMAV